MSIPGGWELIVALSATLGLLVGVIWRFGPRTSRSRGPSAVSRWRLPPTLMALALVVALWPVRADATRYELELSGQSVAQLEARLADPAQRPRLSAYPLCGVPLLAPIHYMQDTSLRRGCAGPNARSMSIAFALLLLAGGGAARGRRRETSSQHLLAD